MVITSKSKFKIPLQFKSAQFRYAIVYVVVTLCVLLFLNIYTARNSQELFYNNKKASMFERCELLSTSISSLSVLNRATIDSTITDAIRLSVSRIAVTDQNGLVLYDSLDEEGTSRKYAFLPQTVEALRGNDVFTWHYEDGAMQSHAAMPIYSFGTLIGCIYIAESDSEQGALIASIHNNIFTITVILELAVIIFSLWFATGYSARLRKIMDSIRKVWSGDYTHKVDIGGNDELTMLGNAFNDLTHRLDVSESKRQRFVSDASHELKTPLASIKLLSDSILQNDMDPETVKEFVSDIGNEADRLNRMSQKLLLLAKTEDIADSDYEIVQIAPTITRVVRMLSAIAKTQNIDIQTDLRDDSPILILEDDLYQIIFNLVENGIKYNVSGGLLTITLQRDGDTAVVRVQDTGVGISEEALTHIFERFYRVDKARSRKSGGSGLGLSIVRNLVERNRGAICVESTPGSGTLFTVTFPVFDTEEDTP